MKNKTSVVHVRINNPVTIRKEVLKTAIDATKILYAFNEIVEIREREYKLIDKLSSITKNIKKSYDGLKLNGFPELPKGLEIKNEVKPKQEKVVNNEVTDLMSELKSIESKLNSL